MDFGELEELKKKRLWHQLTDEIEQFIDQHPNVDLTPLYKSLLEGEDSRLNRIRWF
jgi:hypothetical protein